MHLFIITELTGTVKAYESALSLQNSFLRPNLPAKSAGQVESKFVIAVHLRQ
jgi:hypothetical protein